MNLARHEEEGLALYSGFTLADLAQEEAYRRLWAMDGGLDQPLAQPQQQEEVA